MTTWVYTLAGGKTGQIRAADDDAAWNKVLELLGQCPDSLEAIVADDLGVAA